MICFVEQDTPFRLKNRKMHKQWIKGAILSEGAVPGDLNFVFCSDPCLLEVNRKFLGHDYYTDVITFDYVEDGKISGDVMISVDNFNLLVNEGRSLEEYFIYLEQLNQARGDAMMDEENDTGPNDDESPDQ